MLKIENLSLKVEDKELLNDFNLEIKEGEIHAIMGPNGIGKSSICKAIMGDSKYEVTTGSIKFMDKDITNLAPDLRAKMGIMLINQSPLAIEGVTNADMLRMALANREGHSVDLYKFNKKIQEVCKRLDIPSSFIHRNINDGMSGGERKKNELMHMWMLEPKFLM